MVLTDELKPASARRAKLSLTQHKDRAKERS